MRVQFEYTQEDVVDSSKRFLARSPSVRANVRKVAWQSAIVVAVSLAVLLREDPIAGSLMGLFMGAVFLRYYPRWNAKSAERTMRGMAAELLLGPGPHICEVELTSEGVWTRQLTTETLHRWRDLAVVEERPDSIDLFTRDGAGVIVRNRAFTTESERLQFVQIARSHLVAAVGKP